MKIIPYVSEKHDNYFADESKQGGYVRGDIDKSNKMWTSYFSLDKTFDYTNNRKSLTTFMDKFVELECMDSVNSLYDFCKQHPEAICGEPNERKFKFFAEDKLNAYLIYIICRENDYNFYVNAYLK